VLQDRHVIDGRTVDAKRALSREEQQVPKAGNSVGARNFVGSVNGRTKKIFVGGLPAALSEDSFRQYFETYGVVTDVVIMYDQQTNRPRGFGFISFDSEDAVDRVLHKTFHDLNGKQVEVKRALPKDANPGGSGRTTGSNGGYQSYGSNSSNSYDGRAVESSRYLQPQNTGSGGYPSSGYSMGGYGYGYGSYGNSSSNGPNQHQQQGYGVGSFGNHNAAAAPPPPPNAAGGYGRNSWGAAPPGGYGYGSSQWGGGYGYGGGGYSDGNGNGAVGGGGYGNMGGWHSDPSGNYGGGYGGGSIRPGGYGGGSSG
ncbi:hypothetical protein M569_15029, partial [Genlisea aurea]